MWPFDRIYRFFDLLYNTLSRDLVYPYVIGTLMLKDIPAMTREKLCPHYQLRKTSLKYPNKVALIQAETGREMSFKQFDEYCSKVANYLLSRKDFKKSTDKMQGPSDRSSIALICDNQLEFFPIWMGINRAGFIPALVNYKLSGENLKHCLKIVDTKAIIVSADFLKIIQDLDLSDIGSPEIFVLHKHGKSQEKTSATNFNEIMDSSSPIFPESDHYRPNDLHDNQTFMYTSGTTGFPKAAKMNQIRFGLGMCAGPKVYKISKDDRFFCSLPLYHANAALILGMQVLRNGNCMVLAEKFSASKFWNYIIKYDCQGFNYIGEICRYLLAQPENLQIDQGHKLKFMIGNGLKPELWSKFTKRFNIPRVCEFYGATEGCSNLANFSNKEGAVGFISQLLHFIDPVKIIKVDQETEEPIRDPKTGFVLHADFNEPGMIIGQIKTEGIQKFEGYNDKLASSKKVLQNVFKKGDKYFVSGDLATYDKYGWVQFKDRTGDTFRWKGENCSTAEVDARAVKIISEQYDLACVSCKVPENDGACGLLCVGSNAGNGWKSDEEMKNLAEKLFTELPKSLPSYQIPVFIRFTEKIAVTGTFKIQKAKIRNLGFDLSKLPEGDRIFVLRREGYVLMDEKMYGEINEGKLRL